ncbi:MAG: hypothetical protein LBN93_11665 [Candidatus Symbiothrix sp.]|jgi:hypothetical protein|nr:hypothetical protein [Candidatus Symbiothrix sp.]
MISNNLDIKMNREYENKKSKNTGLTTCSEAGALRLTRRRHRAYAERDSIYRLIDNIGLRDMPKELYDKWLHSLDDEAEKYKNEHEYQQVIRLTK